MWDTIKVIIGILLMTVIGVMLFVADFLFSPINPGEVAQGLPAFPIIGFVALLICLIMDLMEK